MTPEFHLEHMQNLEGGPVNFGKREVKGIIDKLSIIFVIGLFL
jgi:hypothetical protein